MKRFIGSTKVNKPLVLALFAILSINNGWLVAQSETTNTNDLASAEDRFQLDNKFDLKKDVEGDPHWDVVLRNLEKGKGTEVDRGQAVLISKEDKPDGGTRTVTKEMVETKIKPTASKDTDTKQVFVDGENGSYKVIVTRVTDCDDLGKCRVRIDHSVPKAERGNFMRAKGISRDEIKKGDKDIENCDDCLKNSVEIPVLNANSEKLLLKDGWVDSFIGAIQSQHSQMANQIKGKRKDADGKYDDSDVSREVRIKIYECELAEDSTDKDKKPLKKDEKLECAEKRLGEIGGADKDEMDPFNRKKYKTAEKLGTFVKAHLKKCLANAEHRDDANCLSLAESVVSSTESSEIDSIHKNISHQIEYYKAEGDATIEDTKVMEKLKGYKTAMANAVQVAERTGNFGPLQSTQNGLGRLHQYFLASQLRRQQYMSRLEMDPEMGILNFNDFSAGGMMTARIEEEFQNAAMPNRSRYGMRNGMNGMNGMRMGMPPYGPMGMQQMPGMMNPMMMRPPGMPMQPGMPYAQPGMMPGMPMQPGMPYANPGMMPGMPMPMPYGQPGMMPGAMPYGRPPFMPYGPGIGIGAQFNAGFGVLPTSGPMGQYGNWPAGGGYPGAYPGAFPGGFGGPMGQPPFPPGMSPTAGYYPPSPFQSAAVPPANTTINTR